MPPSSPFDPCNQKRSTSLRPSRPQSPRSRMAQPAQPASDFGAFRASLLFCPTCRQATPTRERLLLVLPTGNLYEYLCAQCGTSTGSKTESEQGDTSLVIP